MKKTLKIAFGAVLAAGLMSSAMAQNFPDVPEYHWAYDSLLKMKNEGILVGYPDGLYRGGRPATRYELAAAVAAVFEKLKGMIDGMDGQLNALKDALSRHESMHKADIDAIKNQIAQIQNDINAMKSWGDDIANLKRLAEMLEKDMAAMGVDVEALKKDMKDVMNRLDIVEKKLPVVAVHTELNAFVAGGSSRDSRFGITVDNRPTGVRRNGSMVPGGINDDFTVGHEAAITFMNQPDENMNWGATVVFGNMVGLTGYGAFGMGRTVFGDQSQAAVDSPFGEGPTSFYLQNLWGQIGTSIWGQGVNARVGRIGVKTNPWLFQRRDNTPYWSNARWDNGEWATDGAHVGFDWKAVNLDIWVGRVSSQTDSNGNWFQNMWAGPRTGAMSWAAGWGDQTIDNVLGASLGFNLGDRGDVMLNYILLDANEFTGIWFGAPYNRVAVLGGAVNFDLFNGLSLYGGYGKSDLQQNTSSVLDDDNFAYWAGLKWERGPLGVKVGYRSIQPYYGAPGDWGRVAFLQNPVDHEGVNAKLSYKANDQLDFTVGGYFYKGVDTVNLVAPDLTTDDELVGIMASLNYNLNQAWGIMLGFETTQFKFSVGGQPRATWFRVGFHYRMNEYSGLKFGYEVSDYDDKGSGFLGAISSFGGDRKGGLLTASWYMKK